MYLSFPCHLHRGPIDEQQRRGYCSQTFVRAASTVHLSEQMTQSSCLATIATAPAPNLSFKFGRSCDVISTTLAESCASYYKPCLHTCTSTSKYAGCMFAGMWIRLGTRIYTQSRMICLSHSRSHLLGLACCHYSEESCTRSKLLNV